jgi:plastocyanin/mono/diheme cytochrome c family protein
MKWLSVTKTLMTIPSERLARVALFLILVGLPLAVFGYQYAWRPMFTKVRTIDILAATPEAGGFQPDAIEVQKGERVRLRFSAPDVTHGIAISSRGLDLVRIDPGQVKEVDVVFDEAGVFTFYCNTWCSPNHWRMRGTITVVDPANPEAHRQRARRQDPVIAALAARGIDIDAPHEAAVVPVTPPSVLSGRTWLAQHQAELPPDLLVAGWRQQHSPAEAALLLQTRLPHLAEAQRWDIIAYLWTTPLAGGDLSWARTAYSKNCAACHGETGRGDGPAAAAINAQLKASAMATRTPRVTSFAPSLQSMGATTEIYYAKLQRGGMGTSMPGFGAIFDAQESWLLANYLWRLTWIPQVSASR